MDWNDALASMRLALQVLDETGAPSDIGAHLDLAIARLEEAIASGDQDNAPKVLKFPPRKAGELEH